MENDHQARIERLELMYRESQELMLKRNDELQTQVAELMKLVAASLKEKGQTSTVENGKRPIDLEADVNCGVEATATQERVSPGRSNPMAPNHPPQPAIYVNSPTMPNLVHGYKVPGSTPAAFLVPDLDEQEEQEKAKGFNSSETAGDPIDTNCWKNA